MHRFLFVGLMTLAATAHADNGYYLDFRASLLAPQIDSADAKTNEHLTGTEYRSAVGIRRGNWVFEPNLALHSITQKDYAMDTATTIRDYASYGLDVRYVVSRGPASFYVRGGVSHAWSDAYAKFLDSGAIRSEPAHKGFGIGGAAGVQFVAHIPQSSLAAAFYLEAGKDITWMSTSRDPTESIEAGRIAMGFFVGSGL